MSRRVVNPKWLAERESEILQDQKIDQTLTELCSQRALIALLARFSRSFKVINLGAGVKRITTEVNTCSKCNGTGEC